MKRRKTTDYTDEEDDTDQDVPNLIRVILFIRVIRG